MLVGFQCARECCRDERGTILEHYILWVDWWRASGICEEVDQSQDEKPGKGPAEI